MATALRQEVSRGPSDSELIQDFIGGDQAALGQFFTRHYDPLFRMAYGWLADQDEAEDMVQTVFLRVIERIDQLRRPEQVTGWVFTIMTNLLRDQPKKDGNQFRAQGKHEPDEFLSDDPTPDEILLHRERHKEVRRVMALLPPDLGQAINLFRIQELTHKEAALAANCSVNAMKMRNVRACKAIKALLSPELY